MGKARGTTATRGPRDATVIATFATAGLTALDAGDVEGARAAFGGVLTYSVSMDARTGKRDPSKRTTRKVARKSATKNK